MLDLMVVHSRPRMNGQEIKYDGWVRSPNNCAKDVFAGHEFTSGVLILHGYPAAHCYGDQKPSLY